MLHMNLATRPFYNERAVQLLLGVVALGAVAATALGLLTRAALSQEHTALAAAVAAAEQQSGAVTREVAELQQLTTPDEVEILSAAAREANRLIDQRSFSWTAFLNQIEATLPAGVMLTALRPEVGDGDVGVRIGIEARDVAAIAVFIDRLEATGAFADLLAREEEMTDDAAYRALVVGRYRESGT